MVKKLFGIFLIIVGLAALAIPLVPGVFLIFMGLYLFGGGGYVRQWKEKRKISKPQ